MEMGQGVPPPMTDIPAPPYPGPPAGFDIGGYKGGPPPPAVYSVQQPGYQYSQQQPQIIQSVQQPGYQYSQQQPQIIQSVQQPGYQYSQQQPQIIQSVQQPGYQYSQQQPQIVQPVNQVVMVQQLPTDAPGEIMCPKCQTTVLSEVKYKSGMLVWQACGILGIKLLWPLCVFPFCMDSMKDVEHSCPVCHTTLHVYKRTS
ncbi:cell death-inducing p53-target protein 1 homolog [Hippoglossus hippoglossus]|uniref:cell death-inducing p53-target protein 1 homolog n=1 Tax=Hippoglossus hippoglossus TaxID=8267 RepID=UPI00148C7F1E|nr:cell death-inducing p53-target protein 1 homolog [Hippoglossus hippoglossus]